MCNFNYVSDSVRLSIDSSTSSSLTGGAGAYFVNSGGLGGLYNYYKSTAETVYVAHMATIAKIFFIFYYNYIFF